MAFWSIAAPILGKVVGAIGANKAAKAQANAGKLDLGHLRAQAEAHGFNPLTVLQATGGAGSMTTAAAPGFLSFLAAQAPSIGETIGNAYDPQRKADLDLTRSQASLNRQMEAESIAQMAAPGSVAHGNREEDDFMAAYAANPDGHTVMRSMTGAPIKVRNDVLYRLGLEPGSLYGLAEDAEAIAGELAGEAQGIGNIGDTSEMLGGTPIVIRMEQQGPVQPALRRDKITVSKLKPSDAVVKGIDQPLLPPFLQKMYEGEWWKKNMWLD